MPEKLEGVAGLSAFHKAGNAANQPGLLQLSHVLLGLALSDADLCIAFTDDDIRTIVRTGEYSDQQAYEWVVRCLSERRNKSGRPFFTGVLPMDRFMIADGVLTFKDLAAKHFGDEESYSVQWSMFDKLTETWPIAGATSFEVPASSPAYILADIRGQCAGTAFGFT